MAKLSAKERKNVEDELALARRKLELVRKDKEVLERMHARKFSEELYAPGKDFEIRMKYQTDSEFLQAAREHDMIRAEFELMKVDEQIKYYEGEVKRLTDALKERS